MPVPPNFSIVTLGVADLERLIAFYESWGWEMRGNRSDGIVWFRTSGTWIGLYDDQALAADAGLDHLGSLPAYRGSTLALNMASEEAVDEAFAEMLEAGATIVKEPARAEWGGYSGYVADPDGHLWEVAFAPGFQIEDGRIFIP